MSDSADDPLPETIAALAETVLLYDEADDVCIPTWWSAAARETARPMHARDLGGTVKLRVRRKPIEIVVERWDGPGGYTIPNEHLLHKGSALHVAPGDYIAQAAANDWYPLTAERLAETFDVIGPVEEEE